MAIKLSKNLPTGFVAEYWKISEITIRPDLTIVQVKLFKNADARLENKDPVDIKTYQFGGEDNCCSVLALESENAYILCYDKLKSLPEFNGAMDV